MGKRYHFNATLFFLTISITAFPLRAMNRSSEERRDEGCPNTFTSTEHVDVFDEDASVQPHISGLLLQAAQGNERSSYQLGLAYLEGQGVRKNLEEAARWFQKAADKEFPPAQYNLGVMYCKGEGVKKNLEEAARWFQKAADQEFPHAQYNLGQMYYEGEGVMKNLEEAARRFQKAADQEFPEAQYNLGVMYYNGEGVAKNLEEAAKWYQKAAERGDLDAVRVLRKMNSTSYIS
ncbi:MAG: sel1 repeat family protein [Holosporales bacterium]|nr:sel1 repeat family protein [Holosporales bacterium]